MSYIIIVYFSVLFIGTIVIILSWIGRLLPKGDEPHFPHRHL